MSRVWQTGSMNTKPPIYHRFCLSSVLLHGGQGIGANVISLSYWVNEHSTQYSHILQRAAFGIVNLTCCNQNGTHSPSDVTYPHAHTTSFQT